MSNCDTCRHSIGCDIVTAQRFRTEGYSMGGGKFEGGLGLVCEKFQRVAPVPCPAFEREPGADDGMAS